MKKATLDQGMKILSLFSGTPCEQVQELLERGLLADLRDGNLTGVNRDRFREFLGLMPREKIPNFPIWGSIKLGLHKSARAYCKEMKKAGVHIDPLAKDILDSSCFTVSKTETEVDIVIVSNADLGFEKGASHSTTCARAEEFGLELCPAEVGPALRLASYTGLLRGKWVIVAMNPITDSKGDYCVFDMVHIHTGPWLNATRVHPNPFRREGVHFAFMRRA